MATITMKDETSEDLIFIMSCRDDEGIPSEEAFSVFYHRFFGFVKSVVNHNCRKSSAFHNKDFIETVIENTFHKVYFRAETFKDGGLKGNEEKMEYRIKGWLSTIAKNEFKILLKSKSSEKNLSSLSYYSEPSELPPYLVEESPTSLPRKLIDDAINIKLTDRARDILLTYMRFKDGNKKLPREELKRLSEFYQTSSDNIRKIKSRALKDVKEYIRKHSDFEIE